MVNVQVANRGKVPKKPRGCNRNYIPKVLEHPTGLPYQLNGKKKKI